METEPAISQANARRRQVILEGAESIVRGCLIGRSASADVWTNTPSRVAKAWVEMTSGYDQKPEQILSKQFDTDNCNEMVVVQGVPFASTCSHHLLPFTGTAAVCYIPNKKVVGLSKLPRLIHCFARRLQMQEEMTSQIADAIETILEPLGVGVMVKAHHTCMSLRGVRSTGNMTTSALRGLLKTDPAARQEFIQLVSNG